MKYILILIFLLSNVMADFNSTKCYIEDTSQDFRKSATKEFYHMLYGIDSYFCENDDINISSYRKIRDSKLQIILSLKDGTKLNVHLRGKIVLPQLKNKAELTFSQNDNSEIDNQSAINTNDDVINDKKMHVGLKYYLYREKKSSAYAKLSLKTSSPFGPYVKFGIDKNYINDDFLETTFNHALYYYTNGDISVSTAVSFFKPISNDYWLGQGNKLYWEKQNFYLNNNVLLYQILDLNNRLVYKIGFTTSYKGNDDGLEHESFNVSTGFFHRFDKWFFIEAVPRFRKERDNHYDNEFLFTLNFGMLLGR